jgi:hypothetical protein
MGVESLKTLSWRVPVPKDQKLVLGYLASFADRFTGLTYPSKAKLRQCTGLTEEELPAALAALKASGLVSWERRAETSNVYTVHLESVKRLAGPAKPGAMKPGGSKSA